MSSSRLRETYVRRYLWRLLDQPLFKAGTTPKLDQVAQDLVQASVEKYL